MVRAWRCRNLISVYAEKERLVLFKLALCTKLNLLCRNLINVDLSAPSYIYHWECERKTTTVAGV